ncbi:MAG TPA: TetR/AcrR family transcriptional regulator [Massilibacterium sp.]|nr:TetR/AcrR family transcriptional regulator [Massilibacterium sp.]
MSKKEVPSLVKDQQLIRKRRKQMVKAALGLFKEKGYHRTTTREIATASGFSIGTLYEYIRTKEDILYLVCDSIYDTVYDKLEMVVEPNEADFSVLKETIISYCQIIDEIQEEILFMYQETKSLSKEALPYVLQKEEKILDYFERLLIVVNKTEHLQIDDVNIELLAHHIVVNCQTWAFRRWVFKRKFTLEQFSENLANMIYGGLKHYNDYCN